MRDTVMSMVRRCDHHPGRPGLPRQSAARDASTLYPCPFEAEADVGKQSKSGTSPSTGGRGVR